MHAAARCLPQADGVKWTRKGAFQPASVKKPCEFRRLQAWRGVYAK